MRSPLAVAACVLAAMVAGCKEAAPPAAPPPEAVRAGDDLQLNARAIELRNKLQSDPYSADAHYQFGLLLLEQADPRTAERELSRALELGMDPNQVLPPLARTWITLGRSADLIREHSGTRLTDPAAAAELKVALARACANTGDPRTARELADAALKDAPRSARARVLQAEIGLADRQVEQSARIIDAVLADHPDSVEALELKGDILLMTRRDAKGAADAYERALAVVPRNVPLHAKTIALAIGINDLDTAVVRLKRLAAIAPGTLPHRYLKARLDYARGDLGAARDEINIALTEYPKDLRSLLLFGEIDLKAGSLRTAEEALANALVLGPRVARTRLLLAQTYLRLGAPDKAQLILEPLVRAPVPDPIALGLAADAALQAGLPRVATRLFERAAAADPGNPRFKAAVAMARISKGEVESGFSELEAAAVTDTTPYSDMALVTARLAVGDLRSALVAAQRVVEKQPERASPQWVLGQLKHRAKQPDAARKHFERALELDKAYVPAAVALAEMDLQAGQPAQARSRFEGALKLSPGNLDALLALSEIRHRAGDPPGEITAALENAVRLNGSKARAHVALVNHLIRTQENRLALVAAQRAVGELPQDVNVLEAAGRAQLAAGESAQALSTFRKLVTALPRAPEPHIRMAQAYRIRNETGSAIDSLREAIRLAPGLVPAQVELAELLTADKNWPAALRVVRTLQARYPKDPRGPHLEGLIFAAQKKWDPGVAAFRNALALGGSSETARQLHDTLRAAGKTVEAKAMADQWLAKHGRDNYFLGYLGELALAQRDFAAAEAHFRSILKTEPNSAGAGNNLAWLLTEQGKPEAIDWANKAVAMQPNRALYQDTLSMALAANNRLAEALANQKKAVAMAPDLPVLRLNLARLAIRSGDYTLARAELDKLSAMGKKFPAQAEIWKLRQQLP